MAFDERLAARVRELVSAHGDVTEKRMFGGLAFLVGGHMAVAASGQGGLLVRVDRADGERLCATTNAEPMVMRGRPVQGWLRIDAADVRTKRQLETWVRRGVAAAVALSRSA